MDYEKKYKEALEKARQIHDADRVSGIDLTICETIFPELKESEDKKIKKEIISHLKYLGKYCQESMPNVNEWITWIEKQGDKNPINKVEPTPAWSEVDKDFMYDTLSNLTELKDRYGEGYGNVGKCIDWLKSLKDRAHPQQKQEWSEIDEEEFQIAIDTLVEAGQHASADWLQSIKDRYTWKPSDEQMEALDWALSLAKNCGEECAFYLRTLQDQLKKLKE